MSDQLKQELLANVGPLSPLKVTCDQGKVVTLTDMEESEPLPWHLIARLFQPYPTFTPAEKVILHYQDQRVDIPLVEFLLYPSYAAIKRILKAKVPYVPSYYVWLQISIKQMCLAAVQEDNLLVLKWLLSQVGFMQMLHLEFKIGRAHV